MHERLLKLVLNELERLDSHVEDLKEELRAKDIALEDLRVKNSQLEAKLPTLGHGTPLGQALGAIHNNR